jgi:hypothetical protein
MVYSYCANAIAAGYLVGAGTIPGTNAEFTSDDIVEDHSYAVLAAYTITNGTGSYPLLQIRNPWGVDHFTGAWNDQDTVNWSSENLA